MTRQAKKPKPKTEAQIQIEFFEIVNALGAVNVKYHLIYANGYGVKAPIHVTTQMKRQGSKDGTADVCCPFPNNYCNALYIEFKKQRTYQRKSQRTFQRDTIAVGNGYCVARSAVEALRIIQKYIDNEDPHLYKTMPITRKRQSK